MRDCVLVHNVSVIVCGRGLLVVSRPPRILSVGNESIMGILLSNCCAKSQAQEIKVVSYLSGAAR